jgi:hypothetical protein
LKAYAFSIWQQSASVTKSLIRHGV